MKKTLLAAVLGTISLQASAALFSFSNEFSGGTDCANAVTGCATLDVTQQGANVHFKLAGTMTGTEFITGVYGNREPYAVSVGANFSGTGLSAYEDFSTGQDSFKADGDGYFDWKIDLSSNPPRFDGIDVLEWDIVGTLADFVTGISQNGGDPLKNGFRFALHAQGLVNNGSGWFNGVFVPGPEGDPDPRSVVPEPGSLPLVALALSGFVLAQHKRKEKL